MMEKLDPAPTTLEDAIDKLHAALNDREHMSVSLAHPNTLHMGLGMRIRNEWSLWTDSILANHFRDKYGLGHADDMSGMILKGLYCKVRNITFNPELEAAKYRDYWENKNIDPLMLEEPIL